MRDQSSSPSSTGAGRAVAIEMPRLSTEEGTATLSAWLVAVGDQVEKGALVAELETDKATVELEAPVEGRIESLLVAAGTEGLKPGVLLGQIAPTAAVVVESASQSAPASAVAAPARASAPDAAVVASVLESPARSSATPLARRVAEVKGIDLERVTGTGAGGRIEKADVERSESGAPIARAVGASAARGALGEMPRAPAHLSLRCRMEAVLAARARLNETRAVGSGETRITLNDFIVRAVALALRDVPAANLRRIRDGGNGGDGGNGVESVEAIDVAVVAATEAGPVTLILRDADRKGLAVLSKETRSLVEQARAGVPPELSDSPGTIAITSFARFGIESAFPMLPREQICLLGVGTVIEEPVVQDGAVTVGSTLSLTLAFDPGAVGGAVAAQLLGTIRGHLEDPLSMML